MKYKAIFLDIDDTLLDYVPCCRTAFDAAMSALSDVPKAVPMSLLFDHFFAIAGRLFSEAKHGKHTIAEVMDLYPAEFIEKMVELEQLRITEEEKARMTDIFKHAFRQAWGETHTLVPETMETLRALRAEGYRLFAASNSFGHLQRSRLTHAGLLPFFEDTYISMDIGYDKPDIRFYREALRRCDLQPSDVLMVGDSMTTDIVGAQQAGLDTCWFNRYEEQRHEALPTYQIRRLSELLTLCCTTLPVSG